MKRVISIALVFVLAAGLLAGCGTGTGTTSPSPSASTAPGTSAEPSAVPSTPAASGGTIKIGLLGCFTGDAAQYGLAVQNGAMLYIDQLNAAGGVNGKQLEVIAYDDKGDATESVNAFTRMADEGITALLGRCSPTRRLPSSRKRKRSICP
jgi:branched-chain amino acid transport system substrate-binding protein